MKFFQLIVRPVVTGGEAGGSLLFIQSEPGKDFSQTVKKYSEMTPDEQSAYKTLITAVDPGISTAFPEESNEDISEGNTTGEDSPEENDESTLSE